VVCQYTAATAYGLYLVTTLISLTRSVRYQTSRSSEKKTRGEELGRPIARRSIRFMVRVCAAVATVACHRLATVATVFAPERHNIVSIVLLLAQKR